MYPLGQPVRPEFRKPGISRTGGVIPPAGQVSNLWESSTQQCSGRTWPGGPRPGPAASASLCPTTPVWGLPRTGAPKPAWNGWAGVVACGNEQGGDRLDAHPVDHSGLIERRSPSPGLLEETDDDRSSAGRRPSTSRSALLRRGAPACGRDPSGRVTPQWAPESAIEMMGSLQISVGILSVSTPSVVGWPQQKGSRVVRRINEYVAELAHSVPKYQPHPFSRGGSCDTRPCGSPNLPMCSTRQHPALMNCSAGSPVLLRYRAVVKPSPADAQIVRRPAPMCHSAWPVPSE